MSAPYQHIPILGPRSIRVLELQPAADPKTPVSCQLRNISLNDFPQWHANYTAISYTWDGQNPSCENDCDGADLLITPNCNAAIRQLRSVTETKVLWIDSICIDQSPEAVEERNIQVALMGDIYRSAARVVVWLGPSNECVERALHQVMDIAIITRSEPVSLANRRLVQGRLLEYTRRSAEKIPWPVLMIALGAMRAVRYKWGRWEEVTKLQKQLTVLMVARRFPGSKAIMDDNPGNVYNDPLAFDILTGTREKLAGNERDKVIALYGLFAELEIPIPRPDYKLSVEDIYRQATVAAIKFDKTLYILYHVPSDKRRKTLASRVPDDVELAAERLDRMNLRFHAVGGTTTADLSMTSRTFGRNPSHSFVMVSNLLKCFFYTENRYFGTAPDPLPESMQAGDVIALVSGLEMPLVLRSVEGGYRLITHVYLHGVMFGEQWPETDGELVEIALL